MNLWKNCIFSEDNPPACFSLISNFAEKEIECKIFQDVYFLWQETIFQWCQPIVHARNLPFKRCFYGGHVSFFGKTKYKKCLKNIWSNHLFIWINIHDFCMLKKIFNGIWKWLKINSQYLVEIPRIMVMHNVTIIHILWITWQVKN